MRKRILSILSTIALLIYPLSLSSQNSFSLSLDLIADGGAGNQRDDGVTSGTVSGQGTTIAVEVFATGVTTSLIGFGVKFDFDASLLTFSKAENSAFAFTIPEATGMHFAATSPVTLDASGFLVRAEFITAVDVAGREFSIGIESVTLAESISSSDEITTTNAIAFNATPKPASFSLSLDMDGAAGDQAVTSVNVSPDQVVAIQLFGTDIQNATGISARVEYDASQAMYEGFDVGTVLPNAQVLPEEGANPTFVQINMVSFGGQATVNRGLLGTIRFRTTASFTGTAIRLVRAELGRGGQFERVTLAVRVELQLQSVPSPDFDGDGMVGFRDFVLFAGVFGSRQGDGTYEAKYDLDGDGAIGFSDFVIFAADFGQMITSPPVPTTGVSIPDADLRMAIGWALGKAAPITKADMATLTRLEAENSNISNLTGLEFATGLDTLNLGDEYVSRIGIVNSNSISDLSPLAGLTRLKWLYLDNNSISDLAPLVANTRLGSGDEVDVRGNPLSETSINTHIPVLQRRGVTVIFR